MTINRKIKDYRHTIKWKLIDLKEEANKVAEEIVRNAPDDINSKTPGIITSQGAIHLAILGTEIRECEDRLKFLDWLESEDET